MAQSAKQKYDCCWNLVPKKWMSRNNKISEDPKNSMPIWFVWMWRFSTKLQNENIRWLCACVRVLQHMDFLMIPSLTVCRAPPFFVMLLPFSLIMSKQNSFVIPHCVRKTYVYFPFLLWFWYVGACRGCFFLLLHEFGKKCMNSFQSICSHLIFHCLIVVPYSENCIQLNRDGSSKLTPTECAYWPECTLHSFVTDSVWQPKQ